MCSRAVISILFCMAVVVAAPWPLVGREGELTRIAAAVSRAAPGGVLLTGPAGMGRSRLARECTVTGAAAGFACERVLATPSLSGLPLGSLAPLLPPLPPGTERRDDVVSWAVGAILADREYSGGSPQVLRELILGALDAGALRNDDGVWRLGDEWESASRLVDLVSARMAGLGTEERDLLDLLAVAGSLDLPTVHRLGMTRHAINSLQRRDLVTTGDRVGLTHPLHGRILRASLRGRHGLLTGDLLMAGGWFTEAAAISGELGEDHHQQRCLAGRLLAAARRGDTDEVATALACLDADTPPQAPSRRLMGQEPPQAPFRRLMGQEPPQVPFRPLYMPPVWPPAIPRSWAM